MERHKCKLCSRTFNNGRALGGHMKAHLATLPLPPKPQTFHDPPTESASASLSYESESEQEEEEVAAHQRESEEKALMYGLRENPKKSFRLADPEFSFVAAAENGVVVVQDRESETESKNPTGQRSKRNRKSSFTGSQSQSLELKKPKLSFMESPEPVSSVSDFSPEEDVAMCLMMLSRDMWNRNRNRNTNNNVVAQQEEQERTRSKCSEIKLKRVRGKQQCDNCGKKFRSSRALGSHRSICCRRRDEQQKPAEGEGSDKIFQCPFCFKVFGSGQALGGHKRSHLMASASSNANNNDFARLKDSFIDLNLPAPAEDDDLSVVSDVSVA